MRLLAHLLNRFIRNGELRLIAADGAPAPDKTL
jgi:hypothetical protein